MIRGVKARPFEYDADRCVDLVQGLLATLRAASQRLVGKFLGPVELDAAASTPIGINWHNFLFTLNDLVT